MRIKFKLGLIALCLHGNPCGAQQAAGQPDCAQVLPPEHAGQCAGHKATIEGSVTDVRYEADKHRRFVNFGGHYPHHLFSIVVFPEAEARFPQAKAWRVGTRLRVTGQVTIYEKTKKPEIILDSLSRVEILTKPFLPQID